MGGGETKDYVNVKGAKDEALTQQPFYMLSGPSGVSQNMESRVKITQSHANLSVCV